MVETTVVLELGREEVVENVEERVMMLEDDADVVVTELGLVRVVEPVVVPVVEGVEVMLDRLAVEDEETVVPVVEELTLERLAVVDVLVVGEVVE